MSTITIAILIFVVTLILYGVNKFSMGTVGMITMAALLVTGCLAPKDALGYFANKNVILMLSMFVVSAGLSRTTFLDAFSDTIVKLAKGSFKRTYGADHGRFADCVYDSDGNQLHPCRDGRRRI